MKYLFLVFFPVLLAWQIIQTLVGLFGIVVSLITGHCTFKFRWDKDKWWFALVVCYDCNINMGGCHGWIILMPCRGIDRCWEDHEYGHVPQSIVCGLLYYIIVGIPSYRTLKKVQSGKMTREERMNSWPEKQADRLGGVTRQAFND